MEQTNDITQATRIEYPGTPLAYRVTGLRPHDNAVLVSCDYPHNENRPAILKYRGLIRDLRSGKAVAFK